jgi:hypothetical protein
MSKEHWLGKTAVSKKRTLSVSGIVEAATKNIGLSERGILWKTVHYIFKDGSTILAHKVKTVEEAQGIVELAWGHKDLPKGAVVVTSVSDPHRLQ